MKTKRTLIALLLALAPISQIPASESAGKTDKTLSPYFHVKTGETSTDVMPLKSTNVKATIAGVIADVIVTQTYSNAGGVPLEATYVFPGSTRAAVYRMQMKIGDHLLKAKVQPRQEARRTYEQAKTEGKSASLLEQHRPNVFQMNVANIMPGDTVEVELRYTELLVPESGEYSFIYPTVVGPRYSNQPESSAAETDKWIKNPYLMKGEKSPSTFSLAVDIAAGMPLLDLRCETHDVKPQFTEPARATIALTPGDATANNRDFILKYRLADSKIASGLMVSTGEKENFFLLTVQPPKRGAPISLPPRDYIFVLDVSGSMHGFPIQTAKQLIRQLFTTLKPNDTFNVLLFSGGSSVLSPTELPATNENLARALAVIDQEQGGGGTELLPALKEALAPPNQNEAARSVVVITDGYVGCEAQAFDLIRGNLNRANLFAFGIGSSVNRHLIEGMARAGQGEPFIVTKPDDAEDAVRKFRDYVAAPLLTHIAVEHHGFEVYDVEPLSVPDLLADRPLIVFGKWKGNAQGNISVRGKTGGGDYQVQFSVGEAQSIGSSNALAYLWARARIASLADYGQLGGTDERVKEATNLGLTYNLLTAYTSFVAVDDVVRNPTSNAQTVKQPLPLPANVENSAVGTPIHTTPEPGTWALLTVVAAVLGGRVYYSRKAKWARA
ncbi:MAG TPA: VIT and VWA domain-containing protein [Chthoniobacterales bacterium]|nr:VIT and VWA domain-containing protein [Chthoniobacterales bacterium]